MQKIDIGDTVHHGPTGETWIIARATDTHVYPAGWPPCRADLADCTLIAKATDSQRKDMMTNCQQLPIGDERRVA